MATNYRPMTLDLIDEGEFLEDINSELQDLQRVIARYRRQHGERSHKAKAKLTIEIEIGITNPEDEAYFIKNAIKVTHPKRPSSVSMAIEGFDEQEQPSLFIRASGSDRDDPRQGKLATRDGRVIDPVSGEPVE